MLIDQINEITSTWDIPSNYLKFLEENDSNLYSGEFELFGAFELIDEQDSFGGIDDQLIFIGMDDSEYYYALDLSQGNEVDAPVLYAEAGGDDLVPYANSFKEFLENVG